MGLFCTFQDGICVVWVCFVPLWISFVFLCFRGVQLEAHSTFFTTKMSQNLYCVPLVAHHEWELFCTIETFFVPQSDSIPHFMFQGSHMSQEGLKQVSHPLIFEYWARDSDLGFRSQRRGVA